MKSYEKRYFCIFFIYKYFVLFCICLETIKIRWQFSQEFENNAYLQVANNKLTEININLKTEYYHLSSPAKVERHAKEILQMVEVTKAINVTYEK